MNEVSEQSNIIKVQFKGEQRNIPHEIAHPASKHFEEDFDEDFDDFFEDDDLDFDPLNDLLTEFDHVTDETVCQKEDFIYHLELVKDPQLNMNQSAIEMGQDLLGQMSRINEGFRRLKYYLDEMNIDD